MAVALVIGIGGPSVLWKNTNRTIRAEEERQAKALSAARGRLAATLAAESRRLQERLSFERGETDRAELRQILDNVAKQLLALDEAVGSVNAVVAGIVDEDPEDPVARSYREERLNELSARIRDASNAAGDEIERVRLRLGPDGDRLVQRAILLRMRSVGVRDHGSGQITHEKVEKIAAERTAIIQLRRKFTGDALKSPRPGSIGRLKREPSESGTAPETTPRASSAS